MTITTNFQEVSIKRTKSVPCAGCGRALKRTKKFWQTLNPFNVKKDETPRRPKMQHEILGELHLEAAEWLKAVEWHGSCRLVKLS